MLPAMSGCLKVTFLSRLTETFEVCQIRDQMKTLLFFFPGNILNTDYLRSRPVELHGR